MNCSYRGLRSCKNDASYGMLCDKHANKCKACGHPTVQKFCVEHECPSRECHERVERDSRSCASHRCVAAECSEVKKLNSKYCDMHSCAARGDALLFRPGSGATSVSRHGRSSCGKASLPGYRYCAKHVCNFPSCDEETRPDLSYCQFHMCRYVDNFIPDQAANNARDKKNGSICNNPTHNGGNFCEIHTCKFCNEMVDEATDCCKQHSCLVCSRPAPHGYCEAHQCVYEKGCTSPQATNSKYCRTHKCEKCQECVTGQGAYCNSHTCTVKTCVGGIVADLAYCVDHKCTSCDMIVANGAFCDNHECAADRCAGEKIHGSRWCVSHVCHACDSFAERKFFDKLVCDKHFGLCIDCVDRPAVRAMSRCMQCYNSHEITKTFAKMTQKMIDTTENLKRVEAELEVTKKTASQEAVQLRQETTNRLHEAEKMVNAARQEAAMARQEADAAKIEAEQAAQMASERDKETSNIDSRVQNTERELNDIKRRNRGY